MTGEATQHTRFTRASRALLDKQGHSKVKGTQSKAECFQMLPTTVQYPSCQEAQEPRC